MLNDTLVIIISIYYNDCIVSYDSLSVFVWR